MTTGIAVAWWIFLILVVLLTVVNVYLLARVVLLARSIRLLACHTLRAAGGIAANTAAGADLLRTGELTAALAAQTGAVAMLTGGLAQGRR